MLGVCSVLILFLLLLHLETLELRKDVFFHQMERACMLQEHHGNNTMKDFSWAAMKARIISWDDVPGSIRRKCRWSGIIPRIGFCSARHSQFLFWDRPYRCYDWTTLRKMLGNVLKETVLTIVESLCWAFVWFLVLFRFCVRLPGLLFYCWHQSIDRVRLALTDLAVNLFDVGANYN